MKKSLTLVLLFALAAVSYAQKAKESGFVNESAVKAAARTAVKAATTPVSTVQNNLVLFSDTGGSLGGSALNQGTFSNNGGTSTGVVVNGTAPLGTLHLIDSNSTMRIENYAGANGGSPNFNFYSANGSNAGSATGSLSGDNLGQFAASGYVAGLGFPASSKAKISFLAAENWSGASNNGTAMTFATTAINSAKRTVRLIIDGNGNVGIGNGGSNNPVDTAIGAPDALYVNGAIHSASGGIVFPDGTLQTTAGGGGKNVSSPTGTILFGTSGTGTTADVNTAKVQARVTGSCTTGQAVTAVNADGTVTCASSGGGGITASTSVVTVTGSYGSGNSTTIYTPTTAGLYRVSVYMNVPTAGTCSSAPCPGETLTLQWNDGVSTTALATANCNLVTPCASSYVVPIYVGANQAITAYGQSYGTGSTTPTGGSWTAYILVEQL